MTPPRVPRTLVRWCASRDDRAVILGDLDEEFAQRALLSLPNARRWYWTQSMASMPAALGSRWRRANAFGDLGGDLRQALRVLRRQPAFAAAAVLTMALGAGITTGVTSVVEAVLVRPLPYGNGDRVVALQERDPGRGGANMSWADFVDLSERLRAFASIAGYQGGSRTLTGSGPVERLPAVFVTASFFDVLGVAPALGRGFVPADARAGAAPVVVLSDAFWRRRLNADPAAIGRQLMLSGEPFTIVGVLPQAFVFPPRADPEIWMPLVPSRPQRDRHYLHFLDVVAVTRPGVSPAVAADDLHAAARAWNHNGEAWHAATALQMVSLREDMVSGVRPALLVLLGAAVLVLLASAANVSGLVLARASGRSREIGVRAALGATTFRLVRQLIVEAICLAALGSTLGLLLGHWAVSTFAAMTPERVRAVLPYANQLTVSPRAAAFSALLTVVAVVLASIAPALQAARHTNPFVTGVRVTAGRAETRMRSILVAAQLALAVVLLAGAALVGRSVLALTRVSPGFDMAGLTAGRVSLSPGRYATRDQTIQAVDRVLESVRAVPGVSGAEVINQLPLTGRSNTGDFAIVGRATTPSSNPLIRDVSPGYFALMRIPLLEGRNIGATDTRAAPPVVLVNRTLARFYFPAGDAIGHRIQFDFFDGRPEWTIVGIVGDEQFEGLDRPMAPVVYFPFAQDAAGGFSLVVRSSAPEAAGDALRKAVAAVDPEAPLFGLRTLERMASESNAMFLRALVTRLLVWFSIAALILGAVGVYGVLSEAIAARTREIGVRMALGATRAGIARLVLAAGVTPSLIGLVAGSALTVAAAPALRSLLFGITLLDAPTIATVILALALATLAACALPAWRAARLPVTTALRQD